MADSCWIKFLLIRKTLLQVQDFWKDGEFSKWLLSPLDQKSFPELLFKEFKNRKRSGYVDRQQVRSIDRNLFFFKLKLLILRRWWQLWMKSTTIKQRYGMNLFFVVFRLSVLLPNLMSKLIHNRCKFTCKLIIQTTAACSPRLPRIIVKYRTLAIITLHQWNNFLPISCFFVWPSIRSTISSTCLVSFFSSVAKNHQNRYCY